MGPPNEEGQLAIFSHIAFAHNASGKLVAASELFQLEPAEHTCVACGRALELHCARKGVAYFSHRELNECFGGAAEGLRAAAVQILRSEGGIAAPSLKALARKKRGRKESKAALPTDWQAWGGGEPHTHVDGVPVDFVAETLAGRLAIQIALQGEPDPSLRERLRGLPMPVLEVVLKKPAGIRTFADLRFAVVEGGENKRWLAHPALEMELTPLERQLGWEPSPVPLDGHPAARARLTVPAPSRRKAAMQDFAECTVFHQLPTYRKIEIIEARLGQKQANWPTATAISVRGGETFGCDVQVWEGDAFSHFVLNPKLPERVITSEAVLHWLASRYEMQPPFTNAEKVAVYDYLSELVHLGYLSSLGGQRYQVLRRLPAGTKDAAHWVPQATLSVSALRQASLHLQVPIPLPQVERLLDFFDNGHPAESVESFVVSLAYRLHTAPKVALELLLRTGVVARSEGRRGGPTGELF